MDGVDESGVERRVCFGAMSVVALYGISKWRKGAEFGLAWSEVK